MRPNRLWEIKANLGVTQDLPQVWRKSVADLIEEVERLQARETELLAANNREVERRRDAERVPERIFAAVDAFRIRGDLDG